MGLPGSGKTYLTERLQPLLKAAWYNADKVREMANDWDFSDEGRTRQSMRMRSFADFEKGHGRYVMCDFVCPTKETRANFDADITIWMDTIEEGRFEDTNRRQINLPFNPDINASFAHLTEQMDPLKGFLYPAICRTNYITISRLFKKNNKTFHFVIFIWVIKQTNKPNKQTNTTPDIGYTLKIRTFP